MVPMYHGRIMERRKPGRKTGKKVSKTTGTTPGRGPGRLVIERIQTGVRMEKRLVKVLKALAEYHDITLGDLLEGIVLYAFAGRSPFGKESRERIDQIKRIYGLDLDESASHRLRERSK